MTEQRPAIDDDEQAWVELGERLRSSREYLGFSQGEVAEHMSLSRPAISNIEAGRRKVSTFELSRLAALYRRPYEYFLGEAPDVPQDETAGALFRTAQDLSERDKEQVLRFAEFLRNAGQAPSPRQEDGEP
ncbi:MAG TPA: helix-turn-helix transcriptional regulator [Solirubrobacteraceae bacterium]|jgi:transcriptional regulator with XRE-family HTH domain